MGARVFSCVIEGVRIFFHLKNSLHGNQTERNFGIYYMKGAWGIRSYWPKSIGSPFCDWQMTKLVLIVSIDLINSGQEIAKTDGWNGDQIRSVIKVDFVLIKDHQLMGLRLIASASSSRTVFVHEDQLRDKIKWGTIVTDSVTGNERRLNV